MSSGKTLALLLFTTAIGLKLLVWSSWASASEAYSPYDYHFHRYAARYMPDYDWRWLVAQCRQESGPNFNRFAISHANAKGVCQFMPATWVDAQLALGFVASPFSAKHNIKAAGWYMRKMLYVWRGRGRDAMEKLPLAQSSYNCGVACILRSQRKANDARDWLDIAPFMPAEAREYPIHIQRHYLRMTD